MTLETHRVTLYHRALSLLTIALLLMSVGYARLHAENRQLAADVRRLQIEREERFARGILVSQYVNELEYERETLKGTIVGLQSEIDQLHAENKDWSGNGRSDGPASDGATRSGGSTRTCWPSREADRW